MSLTPRRELRALALPSEIMRLENLSGYLKFPGPFPVASIRLKYVARPKAAERFVARDGDGADPRSGAEEADTSGVSIPEPSEPDLFHPAADSGVAATPPEPAAWQGELDLVPLPGEASEAQPDVATIETAETEAGENKDKAPDVDGGAAAQAPRDSQSDAGSVPADPPPSSDTGAGRGSDWG